MQIQLANVKTLDLCHQCVTRKMVSANVSTISVAETATSVRMAIITFQLAHVRDNFLNM